MVVAFLFDLATAFSFGKALRILKCTTIGCGVRLRALAHALV
jgi:hypothetical protein